MSSNRTKSLEYYAHVLSGKDVLDTLEPYGINSPWITGLEYIGRGGEGAVVGSIYDRKSGERLCMKIDHSYNVSAGVVREYRAYSVFQSVGYLTPLIHSPVQIDEDRHCMVMARLSALSSCNRGQNIFAPLARELDMLHQLGYTHGDVKLNNLMLAGSMSESRAIGIDLGYANGGDIPPNNRARESLEARVHRDRVGYMVSVAKHILMQNGVEIANIGDYTHGGTYWPPGADRDDAVQDMCLNIMQLAGSTESQRGIPLSRCVDVMWDCQDGTCAQYVQNLVDEQLF